MIPYFIFASIMIFLYYKKKHLLMLLTLIAFASLRYNTGWDYASYEDMTTIPKELDRAINSYSFLWGYFLEFCYNNSLSHFAIIVPNILTYTSIFISLKLLLNDDKERISESLLVYGLWPFFYLASFSTIRQTLAIATILLTYALFDRKKIIIGALTFFLSYLIHPSSLVALTIIPFTFFNYNIKYYHIIISVFIGTFLFSSLANIIALIDIYEFGMYADSYLENSDSFGSKLSILLFMIFIYFSFNWYISDLDVKTKYIYAIIITSFATQIVMFFIGLNIVTTRVLDYFTIFMVLDFIHSAKRIMGDSLTKLIMAIALGGLFFVYLIIIDTPEARAMSSSPYIPYQWIWNK